MEDIIEIYTDGSADTMKREGGWSFYCPFTGYLSYGYDLDATNNKMEIKAVARAIQYGRTLGRPFIVKSDSQYVVKGINIWMEGWEKAGFKDKKGKDRPNKNLWLQLMYLKREGPILIEWVKGHSNNIFNTMVDEWAVKARTKKIFKK